jgi:hypothetical protein
VSLGAPQSFTPPEYAAMRGVSPEKVLWWINRGILHAVNMASEAGPGMRKRWAIPVEAIAEFEGGRSNVTAFPMPVPARRNNRDRGGVIQFFK